MQDGVFKWDFVLVAGVGFLQVGSFFGLAVNITVFHQGHCLAGLHEL